MNKQSVSLVSLGCPKNLVDAEVMLGHLPSERYQIVTDESQAEIIIVNTCSFIKEAKEESIETILEVAELGWSQVAEPGEWVHAHRR